MQTIFVFRGEDLFPHLFQHFLRVKYLQLIPFFSSCGLLKLVKIVFGPGGGTAILLRCVAPLYLLAMFSVLLYFLYMVLVLKAWHLILSINCLFNFQ